jgi:hypothetical protein
MAFDAKLWRLSDNTIQLMPFPRIVRFNASNSIYCGIEKARASNKVVRSRRILVLLVTNADGVARGVTKISWPDDTFVDFDHG